MSGEIKLGFFFRENLCLKNNGWLRLLPKAINKTAYVTYVPRIDKTGIKKIVTSDCK